MSQKLRVWHVPQLPGKPFHVDVDTPAEGKKVMGILADYDIFQFENRIKPDYCNTGGLEVFEDGEWCEWCDDETESIDDWTPTTSESQP